MPTSRFVPFISDEKLIEAVGWVVENTKKVIAGAEQKIDKNRLDPFSAIFDSTFSGLDYETWLKKEKSRQIQKAMQNYIGDFHQMVIGGIEGWENLGKGDLVDVRNKQKKLIAEIKNKFNTCRGADLIEIYDELDRALHNPKYKDFQAYYVTVIGRKKDYCGLFTPSDRSTHSRRPASESIKEISGHLFYDIATGQKDSLLSLLKALPMVLESVFKYKVDAFKSEKLIEEIYARTYKWGNTVADEECETDA